MVGETPEGAKGEMPEDAGTVCLCTRAWRYGWMRAPRTRGPARCCSPGRSRLSPKRAASISEPAWSEGFLVRLCGRHARHAHCFAAFHEALEHQGSRRSVPLREQTLAAERLRAAAIQMALRIPANSSRV